MKNGFTSLTSPLFFVQEEQLLGSASHVESPLPDSIADGSSTEPSVNGRDLAGRLLLHSLE